jgi:hypothetical protein
MTANKHGIDVLHDPALNQSTGFMVRSRSLLTIKILLHRVGSGG